VVELDLGDFHHSAQRARTAVRCAALQIRVAGLDVSSEERRGPFRLLEIFQRGIDIVREVALRRAQILDLGDLAVEDGTKMTCRIIDMSRSGAAIAAENRPPLKSLVMLGKVQSRVVRNLEEGFELEFVHEQVAETLEDAVTAR